MEETYLPIEFHHEKFRERFLSNAFGDNVDFKMTFVVHEDEFVKDNNGEMVRIIKKADLISTDITRK